MRLLFILFLIPTFLQAQSETRDSLNQELHEIANKSIIPGFAVTIIRDGEIKYANGFGFANIEAEKAYTPRTIQNIGSISKTFIGVALVKAEELDLLDLDEPVNQYLDYKLINPRFPDEVITIRHLATHTSGLNDPDEYEKAYIFEEKIDLDEKDLPKEWKRYVNLYNSNNRKSLDEFVKSIYVEGGEFYNKKNFLKKRPGEKFAYSNIGAGIASRVIENASGLSFEAYTKLHIFDVIGMNETSWLLNEVDINEKAIPYITFGLALPHYSLITFADGGLITNVHDLSQYIMEIMRCYEGQGTLISKEKCIEMVTPYLEDREDPYGIFWSSTKSGLNIGHNGGDPGVLTNMYFMPSTGVAKIMFMNMMPTEKEQMEQVNNVWNLLKEYQSRI